MTTLLAHYPTVGQVVKLYIILYIVHAYIVYMYVLI